MEPTLNTPDQEESDSDSTQTGQTLPSGNSMKLFVLPNMKSEIVSENSSLALSGALNPRLSLNPALTGKNEYGKWMADPQTHGIFISVWEGLNPHGRVLVANPAVRLHGFIADYDNPVASSRLQDLAKSCNIQPTWIYDSFTPGKIRLIWEFEQPIKLFHVDLSKAFVKELMVKIGVKDALPGYDEKSPETGRYFEMGTNWRNTGAAAISPTTLEQILIDCSGKIDFRSTEHPDIPMDVVAAECERLYPGRVPSNFTEGQKCPLFWVDDTPRLGAMIKEHGILCFSDRAESGFVPWKTILGKAFVEKYEESIIAGAAEKFFFDGTRYWTKDTKKDAYIHLDKDNARLELQGLGVSVRPAKGQNDMSDASKVIRHINKFRRVDGVAPFVFNPNELVELTPGTVYLNNASVRPIAPAAVATIADCPWTWDFFTNGLDGEQDGVPAYEFALAWALRFWHTAYLGQPQPGQIMFIAGEANTGKTLVNAHLFGAMVGGSTPAEKIIMGQTTFNKGAAHHGLWRCDDGNMESDYRARQAFTNALKKFAANPEIEYHPKFMDSTNLPFIGRIVVTCNTDPESLQILPSLDDNFKDKVMLFKMKEGYQPHFFNTKQENEERIRRELPFFLRVLLDRGPHPKVVGGARYGVKPFHHHSLVETAMSESREQVIVEMLDVWIEGSKATCKRGELISKTSTELFKELDTNAGSVSLTKSMGNPQGLSKLLNKIMVAGMMPALIKKTLLHGRTRWHFDPHL